MVSRTIDLNTLEIGEALMVGLQLSMQWRDLRLWMGNVMEDLMLAEKGPLIMGRLKGIDSGSARS